MKKIISVLLVVLIVFSVAACSKQGNNVNADLTVSGKVGDIIEIPVKAAVETDITQGDIIIDYDDNELELIDVDSFFVSRSDENEEPDSCRLSWKAVQKLVFRQDSTEVATLKFKVLNKKANGSLVTVSVEKPAQEDEKNPAKETVFTGKVEIPKESKTAKKNGADPENADTSEIQGQSTTFNSEILNPDSGRIICSNDFVKAGEEATVEIRIAKNPGICSIFFTVEYDMDVLTLNKTENGKIFPDSALTRSKTTSSPCNFIYEDALSDDKTDEGVIQTLKFNVNPEAAIGKYPITVKVNESYGGENLDDVPFVIINGAVTVTG